jgi:hypothetical protein
LYLRIFTGRKFRIAAIAVMGLCVAYTLAAVLLTVFACNPIRKSWDKELPGNCVESIKIWYCNLGGETIDKRIVTDNSTATSILNIITDIMIICLPMYEIRRLQLPWSKKLLLCLLFSLGIFVIACTIVRMITVSPKTTAADQTCQLMTNPSPATSGSPAN